MQFPICGQWWDVVITYGGKAVIRRSAERHLAELQDTSNE
jgi:hypothetical protein